MLENQWSPELLGGFLERSDKDEVTSSNLVGPTGINARPETVEVFIFF